MEDTQLIHKGFWETDDRMFHFNFEMDRKSQTNLYKARVNLKFVSKSLNQKPLLKNVELTADGKEIVFFEEVSVDLCIKGTLKASIEKSGRDSNFVVWGDIQHGNIDDLSIFKGPIWVKKINSHEYLPPEKPVVPKPVIEPGNFKTEERYASSQDLFPFICLNTWTEFDKTYLKFNFITYKPVFASPPINSFSEALVTLRKSEDRKAMENEALSFIDNKSPYENHYLSGLCELRGHIAQFFSVYDRIVKLDKFETIIPQFCDYLQTNVDDFYNYLKSPEYLSQKENLWQTYFALIVLSGYKVKWLETISVLLVTCNLAEKLFFNITQETTKLPLSKEQFEGLIHASIILPDNIFPLPDFSGAIISDTPYCTIEPYAIGNLQRVTQKLIRYEPGEIANIISLMPGEKKENTKRSLHQERDKTNYSELSENDKYQNTEEKNADLNNEILNTLARSKETYAYTDYSTNYGAPTSITLNGSYEVNKETLDPGKEKSVKFAKRIINETSGKIHKQVCNQRERIVNTEQEEISVSILDNTGNDKAIYGTYHWLNKVYEAHLINCGSRLMLSIHLSNPASEYVKAEYSYRNKKLKEPKSPTAVFNITSIEDINTENYSQICTHYELADFDLPPDDNKIITGILEGNESKLLNIPEGYEAVSAHVSYVSNEEENQYQVKGLVGRQRFEFYGDKGETENLILFNEDITLPVSATSNRILISPPESSQSFRINIEVECKCSKKNLQTWKKCLFNKLMIRYKEQRELYFKESKSVNSDTKYNNPLYERKTIKKELKKNCIKFLINTLLETKGVYKKYRKEALMMPEIKKSGVSMFFNNAIEWSEMTYTLLEDFGADLDFDSMENIAQGDSNIFAAFLQAEGARIVVPVRPEFNYSVLYFLETGLVCLGKDSTVPVLENQISLISELKKISRVPINENKPLDNWEFKVATSLQVLTNELNLNI